MGPDGAAGRVGDLGPAEGRGAILTFRPGDGWASPGQALPADPAAELVPLLAQSPDGTELVVLDRRTGRRTELLGRRAEPGRTGGQALA